MYQPNRLILTFVKILIKSIKLLDKANFLCYSYFVKVSRRFFRTNDILLRDIKLTKNQY